MAKKASPLDTLRGQVLEMIAEYPPDLPIAATVEFLVKQESESAFVKNADTLTAATRQLPGLKKFSYHKHHRSFLVPENENEDAVAYLIYEEWQSPELFRTQWESEHLVEFQNSVGQLLVVKDDGAPELELHFLTGAEDVGGAPVAVTGLTRCWATNGAQVGCTNTGQDAAFQKGVDASPRFSDNGDGTVTDNLTKLVWLKDADHFGQVTWAEALENANNLVAGSSGSEDWRLPNIRELRSLLDYSSVSPMIPPGHPFVNVRSAIYWSSSTLVAAPKLAWMTTMAIGPSVFDIKGNSNRMWPVRGGSSLAKTGQDICFDADGEPVDCAGTGQDGALQIGVASPSPRFIDNHNGTVFDKLTGLTWLKEANLFGFKTWQEALDACNALSAQTHPLPDGQCKFKLDDGSEPGEWRLPNVKEFESLIDYGRAGPCLPDDHVFDNVRPTSYWTSTTVSSAPTQAMFVILGVGPCIFENKEHPFFAWPVKG